MSQPRLELERFQGPLELLLSLIEQRRLPITEISLAEVADQYLAQVHARPVLDPELLADFLAIGAKLLLLKSRALLPTEEPDPAVEETASELAERLATYRVFRAAAEYLRELELRGARAYPTSGEPQASGAPAPLAPLAPGALLAAWRRLRLAAPPAPAAFPVPARCSVDERRARILEALAAGGQLSFRLVAGRSVDEVIASFLALLELFRRGLVALHQPAPFEDLWIARPGSPGGGESRAR